MPRRVKMEQQKQFTGVWLPKQILEDKDLTPLEKMLYAEVSSFEDCFASNAFFAERYGVSERHISNSLNKLIQLGFIIKVSFDGRKRIIRAKHIDSLMQTGTKPEGRVEVEFYADPKQSSTIDNNIDNNIDNTNKLVLGETPKYGKPEINKAFDDWEQYTGIKISSKITNNRRACNNLLKKYTADELSRLIMGVAKSQEDKYAPRIADFVDLQQKLSQLILWGKQNSIKKVTIGVV
jgi:hypothetical protein